MKKQEKGITLIALVVTIILLLILAGVAISLSIGNNGLFKRAENAVEKSEEAEAREKLEMALANIVFDKNITSVNDEYIDNELGKQEMVVIGNIVIVDDWKFEIDRSVPKIGIGLGKGSQNEQIQINSEVNLREDYVNATLKLKITYNEGNIKQIIVNGISKEVPEAVDGVYSLEHIITENGVYTVFVKDDDGNYKIAKIEVKDITEDMEIWNKADMESFRDKVNSGRTFEERTASVMANINLEGSNENQWKPIANYGVNNKLEFKGTLEGNDYTVEGVYINTNENVYYKGLFGMNNGTIKNLSVKGSITANGSNFVGGITGINKGTIEKCYNYATVKGNQLTGGIVGINRSKIHMSVNKGIISGISNIGGIAGQEIGEIGEDAVTLNCYNLEKVSASSVTAGGIIGAFTTGNVYNCYNLGEIYAGSRNSGGISGAAGHPSYNTAYMYNCYNLGKITSGSYIGEITGYPNAVGGTSREINCYKTNATAELLNNGDYSDNAWIDDIQNTDGTWKYNNGYPILRWQLEN